MLDFLPYQIAAFRETFEEGGILLASKRYEKDKLELWRGMVHKDPEKLLEIIRTEVSEKLDLDRLKYIAEWITPQKYSKRFATKFFLCIQNPDEKFELKEDGQEIVNFEWVDPLPFLEVYSKKPGKYILFPPQYHILATFANYFTTYESILKWHSSLPDPYSILTRCKIKGTALLNEYISTTTPWVTPFLPLNISKVTLNDQSCETFTLPGDSEQTPHRFTTYIDNGAPGSLSIRSIDFQSSFSIIKLKDSINPFSVPFDSHSKL